MSKKTDFFLDSGAYTAYSLGREIDIDEYIKFIKTHESKISMYANLDSIGDAKKTKQNQLYMEKAGLNPLPCFHYGEPIEYLKYYLKHNDYIALGGMVPISTKALGVWLDILFTQFLTDNKGMPIVKIHGFGLTSTGLLLRYPWYSVDSTSWLSGGKFGYILIPKYIEGTWNYLQRPWNVFISNRAPNPNKASAHYMTFSPCEKELVKKYLSSIGFKIGSSKIKKVKSDYELKEGEMWLGPEKDTVEIIIEEGLCNSYKLRDEANIAFFMELEKNIPKWPWALEHKVKQIGFDL